MIVTTDLLEFLLTDKLLQRSLPQQLTYEKQNNHNFQLRIPIFVNFW